MNLGLDRTLRIRLSQWQQATLCFLENIFHCAGLATPPSFTPVAFGATDTIVIAGGDGKAIDNIDRVSIQRFPGLAQRRKQVQKQLRSPMQTTIQSTLREGFWNIAMIMQKTSSRFKVAPEVQHGNDCQCHYFCIAHLALPIFVMVKCLQKVVTQAINCYNLVVHVVTWFGFGLVTFNFTRCHMDFSFNNLR